MTRDWFTRTQFCLPTVASIVGGGAVISLARLFFECARVGGTCRHFWECLVDNLKCVAVLIGPAVVDSPRRLASRGT
jgi:hypothetical protein